MESVDMKTVIRIILLLAVFAISSCGPPSQQFRDYRDSAQEVQEEPLKFSQDPLLNSIYEARYLEMLRRCGNGKDQCRKGD